MLTGADHDAAVEILNGLLAAGYGDFAALAIRDAGGGTIRWPCAAGNRSQRYRRIAARAGQDLAGLALRLNRRVVLQGDEADMRQRAQSPIMLAEGLLAAAAFPLPSPAAAPPGVLLVGSRDERLYGERELNAVAAAAAELAQLLARPRRL